MYVFTTCNIMPHIVFELPVCVHPSSQGVRACFIGWGRRDPLKSTVELVGGWGGEGGHLKNQDCWDPLGHSYVLRPREDPRSFKTKRLAVRSLRVVQDRIRFDLDYFVNGLHNRWVKKQSLIRILYCCVAQPAWCLKMTRGGCKTTT